MPLKAAIGSRYPKKGSWSMARVRQNASLAAVHEAFCHSLRQTEAISLELGVDDDCTALLVRVKRLERQVRVLVQVVRLLLALRRVVPGILDLTRLPDGHKKEQLLCAIDRARAHLPLRGALRIIGLLSFDEVRLMGDMVQSPDFRHMSVRALALHAQRVGRVFAHPITWGRLIREPSWRRPRLRVYPAKPKVGIRANRPNQYWHIDASIIRLVDGTRVYLHAVIDNFSRRILGWRVEARLNPLATLEILSTAGANNLSPAEPSKESAAEPSPNDTSTCVVMDAGVENLNTTVDSVFESGQLRRVLAQVDVTFSNSLIEAWWRSLKHQWLYLHQLESIAAVRRLVAFYVQQHNEVMPHSAFNGLTPDEVYFGKTDGVS